MEQVKFTKIIKITDTKVASVSNKIKEDYKKEDASTPTGIAMLCLYNIIY